MLQYTEVTGLGAHTYKESTHRNTAFHLLFTCRNESQTIHTKQSKTVSVSFEFQAVPAAMVQNFIVGKDATYSTRLMPC